MTHFAFRTGNDDKRRDPVQFVIEGSNDLETLIYQVKKKVLEKTGVNLELEIQIIGTKL